MQEPSQQSSSSDSVPVQEEQPEFHFKEPIPVDQSKLNFKKNNLIPKSNSGIHAQGLSGLYLGLLVKK
jgi:hypothetical protein